MPIIVTAGALLTPHEPIAEPIVRIDDGVITSIESSATAESPASSSVTGFPDCTLVPAFFDVHIHGCAGHDVMEATPEALSHISRFLASRGVGNYLATTVTAPLDATLRSLDGLANLITANDSAAGARAVGIHLEGPFISHAKRGVHPPELLLPCSIDVFESLWQASQGNIRLMTIAPELPGALDLIAYAVALGVRISLGHSDAKTSATRNAIAAGATSATHTFNAMRALDHREPGILGVVLTDEKLYAEIICDGIHVDPAMVSLFWKAKGADRAILVTDGISATGMPEGTYHLGALQVEVTNGKCTSGGVLAGSVLTLDRAVSNFSAFTGATLAQTVALAARNPARMIGLDREIGSLAVGRFADIAVLRPDGSIAATILKGCLVYNAGELLRSSS